MTDLTKCLIAVGLCAGTYGFSAYQGAQGRKFDGGAANNLTMVQGKSAEPGRPIILEFWGTYCGPCIASIPHLNELHARFHERAQFVAVSAEDAGTVKAFLTTHKINYPVAVDTTFDFFKAWNVKGVPTLVVLDAKQSVLWRGHSMEMTDAKLASLLGGG